MFATLLETRAIRPRRTASSITSILLHGVVIGGATLATARETVAPVPAHRDVVFIPVSRPTTPPPVDTRPRQVSPASVPSSPLVMSLRVPDIVPIGIPPIDFSATPTHPDFSQRRIATAGVLCESDCATPARSDSSGRVLWTANDLTMRLANDPVPPRYPESLRRAGVEGDVVAKFVVDTTGRVDMATVEIVRSPHDAFTAAVRETLARLRFHPSTVGERKVKALAVMPFRFTLMK
jgi:protein TonB